MTTHEKLHLNKYDYFMFVDASGDDGFKFGKKKSDGSSICYAVCCFLVEKNNVLHNQRILDTIKQIIGSKTTDEVKYSVLRRHPKSKEIHTFMSQLKGSIFSMVAFKKEITDPEYLDVSQKLLSSFCHVFPINIVSNEFEKNNDKSILIVVDRMKKIEMDTVEGLVKSNFGIDRKGKNFFTNYDIIFRDSKDKDFQLIQAADMLAGNIRNFFENYDSSNELWRNCRVCQYRTNLCSYKRKKILPPNSLNFKLIYKLFSYSPQQNLLNNSLFAFPPECYKNICFINCLNWIK